MAERMEVLMRCPIFKGLSAGEITELLQRVAPTERVFEKNEVLYRTGDTACHIAIILSGSLEIRKYLASGNRLCIFQRTRGELLGGSIVFSSAPKYPCDVVAKEKTTLLFIEKNFVLDVLLKNAAVAANILQISANRIMQFEKRLELFSFCSIQEKIAFSLLHDFQRQGDVVSLPFSKTTWAEYLNVSRTSLSRELKNLCEQGCIEMHGSEVKLLRRDLLETLLWS